MQRQVFIASRTHCEVACDVDVTTGTNSEMPRRICCGDGTGDPDVTTGARANDQLRSSDAIEFALIQPQQPRPGIRAQNIGAAQFYGVAAGCLDTDSASIACVHTRSRVNKQRVGVKSNHTLCTRHLQ